MKTMIIYSTSTAYVLTLAKEIGNRLGGIVEYCNLKNMPLQDPGEFKRIIVGIDAFSENNLADVVQFCENNRDQLLASEVGLFLSCRESGEQARKLLIQVFPEELQYHAKSILMNGGVTDDEEESGTGMGLLQDAALQPEILNDIDRFVRRLDRVFMPMLMFV